MTIAGTDVEVCREHLGSLLTEEIGALSQLEELLEREYDVLAAKNAAAIERTAVIRQQKMSELAQTEEQRRSLCMMHGYSADWLGLEGLMQWCDGKGTLLSLLRECAQRATRCRDLNAKNGTLVAARLRQVESMLTTLTQGAQRPATYGPNAMVPRVQRTREWGTV